MDALWAAGGKHSWSWYLKVNMGFCRAGATEALPERERGWVEVLVFVSYMENQSSGRKEGVDKSRESPEIISEVNTQW